MHSTLDTSGTPLVFMYTLQFFVHVFCILDGLHSVVKNLEMSTFSKINVR